jgi:hypothetical protein
MTIPEITCIVTKSNEVEWLGAFVFTLFPIVLLVCGVVMRYLAQYFFQELFIEYVQNKCKKAVRKAKSVGRQINVQYHERSIHCGVHKSYRKQLHQIGPQFFFSWIFACALVAIIGTCVWLESYGTSHSVECSPVLLALIYTYLLCMFGWLIGTYVVRKYFVVSYIAMLMAFFSAVGCIALFFAVFNSAVDNSSHWCSWISILLLVPIACACFCIYSYASYIKKVKIYANSKCQCGFHSTHTLTTIGSDTQKEYSSEDFD